MDFLITHLPLLLKKTLEQIYLAGTSTLIAVLIGVPLGTLITKRPKFKGPILGICNIFQTIPSLALLAFLLPFLGIGVKPAIVTLAVYAILPIVRNTHTGLQGVPPDLIEAADGVGFTPSQKLWMVEFPIALPVIIAGIRTAAVVSVGIATIAAFIGAGGLGDFIFQGISSDNTKLVLLGAIPAALLALVMDFLFGKIETLFSTSRKLFKKYIPLIAALLFLFSLYWYQSPKKQIVIATKNFTEQFVLGEIIAQLLEEESDYHIIRKFNLGTTQICHKAMLNQEIDIYPEYTGTAYLTVLKEKYVPGKKIFPLVNEIYQKKFHIRWLKPLGFENSKALIVKKSFADKHQLRGISDLAPLSKQLIIAAPAEFLSREDGYLGLKKDYDLSFKEIKQMDHALSYSALKEDQVNVIMGFTTDGKANDSDLVILKDDKQLSPKYDAAILIRKELIQKDPQIAAILSTLSGSITDARMREMNAKVEQEKKSPYEVARWFLNH